MPRDRTSIFAGADWRRAEPRGGDQRHRRARRRTARSRSRSTGRPARRACPGTYHEYFGVVQEGVAWFSDNGQGGPPDDQIEALIDLVPGDPASSPDMGGSTGGGGSGGTPGDGTSGGTGGNGADPNGDGTDGTGAATPGTHAGCSAAGAPSSGGFALVLVLVFAALTLRRFGRRA